MPIAFTAPSSAILATTQSAVRVTLGQTETLPATGGWLAIPNDASYSSIQCAVNVSTADKVAPRGQNVLHVALLVSPDSGTTSGQVAACDWISWGASGTSGPPNLGETLNPDPNIIYPTLYLAGQSVQMQWTSVSGTWVALRATISALT